jgi:hypothetical protein
VAARCKAWFCGLSLAGVLSGKGLASGLSLVQRSPTECDVSEYDREASIMRTPWSNKGCYAVGGRGKNYD